MPTGGGYHWRQVPSVAAEFPGSRQVSSTRTALPRGERATRARVAAFPRLWHSRAENQADTCASFLWPRRSGRHTLASMSRWFWLAGELLLAALAIGVLVVWLREPRYHGRSLSAWLAALDDGERGNRIVFDANSPPRPTKEQLEAAEAVRHMGTNALPELLRLLQAEESPLYSIKQRLHWWLIQSGRVPPTFQPNWHTVAARTRHVAALGIVALEPNARPPASSIVPLFRKHDFCKDAALVLASMGEQGLQPLRLAITTNPPSWQGTVAVWALAQFPTNGQAIVPDLLEGLNSKRPGFRTTCAWALTRIQTDPEIVVQALTNYANEDGMRYLCLKALSNYGARATSAVPFLVEMLHSQKRSRRHDVLETLIAIDPEAAEKAVGR